MCRFVAVPLPITLEGGKPSIPAAQRHGLGVAAWIHAATEGGTEPKGRQGGSRRRGKREVLLLLSACIRPI